MKIRFLTDKDFSSKLVCIGDKILFDRDILSSSSSSRFHTVKYFFINSYRYISHSGICLISNTKWNIIDFLNGCDIEAFKGKIDHYLKSLRAIVDYEEGANQDKARYLLDRYNKDDRPGPDYKDARNWEKRTSVRAGSSFHFHNSTITGNSLGGNSGVINNVKFPKERNRAALSMTYTTGQPILFVGTGQTYTDLKNMRVGHTEMVQQFN
ncbi:signal recognition particle receptor subunit alpha homolog [Rhizophagus irregularis DAOM 181602=DAOM 197198]|nr:signal recognition particle receptor subunit alpha homolog [Rhizophagus irregularis DAOM 181602=DAOM 197198]